MILTYDYIKQKDINNAGVYHNYPLNIERYSGRPQVIDNSEKMLHDLLFKLHNVCSLDMITNTSYNYHGEPIVYSLQDILRTHYKQLKNADKEGVKVNLVIFKD